MPCFVRLEKQGLSEKPFFPSIDRLSAAFMYILITVSSEMLAMVSYASESGRLMTPPRSV